MVIDVRKLNVQKRYVGDLEFEFDGDDTLIDIPFVRFASPVKVRARYEIFEDDSVEVKGKVFYTLEGLCSRCLKETSAQVETELDALFETEQGEDYVYFGGKIDLSVAVRDAVLTGMPRVLSCGEACREIPYR